MTTAFITHADTLLHILDGNHPESAVRITVIKNALIKKGVNQLLNIYQAPLASTGAAANGKPNLLKI